MVESSLAALDRGGAHVIYAALLADLLAERGIATETLLQGTGIAPADLKSIDGYLSTRQYITLINNAQRLANDPMLAFAFGLHLKLSTHGFLGFAAMSASSLGEALELAVKYCRTRFEFMRLLYYRQQGFGVVEIDEVIPMGEAYPFMVEAFMASFGVMSINLLGEIPQGIQVRRIGDKPAYFEDAQQYFQMNNMATGHTVRFNESVNQILIPESHLQRKLVLSDPVARQLAEAQCEKELQSLQVRDDLVYRVTRLLKDFEGAWPKLDQVASQLHVSPRTLKRRLLEANTSFQVLLDQVRMEQARLLLSETRKSVDAIAATLGYSDTSNFNRAFRRWLGMTPAAYRRTRQHREPLSLTPLSQSQQLPQPHQED